ncbi:MAG: DUF192 domain-containing protein [Chloroflexi bacterium]|nr:DUF192 domain-containing protein [Chloroflexota bacterium]
MPLRTLLRPGFAFIAILLSLAVACAAPAATPTPAAASPTLPTATITIEGARGPVPLTVELPRTPLEFQTGLSRRESLPEGRGMLFDFIGEVSFPFTMRETRIPLSIAFISPQGIILELQDMEPLSLRDYQPQQPYRYALEVSRGFFEVNQILAGSRARNLPAPPAGAEPPFPQAIR